jgi:arylsulfatase A-like enzyme
MEEEITTRAIEFIKRTAHSGKPFFAYVAFSLFHMPTLPNPEFAGRTGNGDWADCLAEMDYRTGQILDAIKEAGVEDNTLSSSPATTAQRPLTRGKATAALGGDILHRHGGLAACSIHHPLARQNSPGRVSNEIVHIVDLFTTLAHVGGAEIPQDRPIDGVDQMDFSLPNRTTRIARDSPLTWLTAYRQ